MVHGTHLLKFTIFLVLKNEKNKIVTLSLSSSIKVK